MTPTLGQPNVAEVLFCVALPSVQFSTSDGNSYCAREYVRSFCMDFT